MVFSDTSTLQGLIQDIDFLLFGKSNATPNATYSLADRTRNINNVYDEAIAEMYKADPNYKWDDTNNTDFPIATVAMTSGLDHYTILDSAQVLHRVRMKDRDGNYKTLTGVNRNELDDDELKETGEPEKYYKVGKAIFPVPIPDYGYSAGVELEFQRGANYFVSTDTTKEPGFNPQFHKFLSVGAALEYAIANGLAKKTNTLSSRKEALRNSIMEHYQKRAMDIRPKISINRGNISRFGL